MDFKIDIIGVGFPKCGTSWLSSMMDAHPEINMAKAKETFHFIQDTKLFRDDITGFRRVHSLSELKKQFADKDALKAEFSTMYIFDTKALQAIKEHNPDVKIIVSIRPPWDFLYSAFSFDKNSNFGHLITDNFTDYYQDWDSRSLINIEWSYYSKFIKKLFELFNSSQIHLIFMDDIKYKKEIVLAELWNFIGLRDTSYLPKNYNKQINETKEMRSKLLQAVAHKLLQKLQSSSIGQKFLHIVVHRRGRIRKLLFFLLKKEKQKTVIDAGFKEGLKNIYRADILKTHEISGNDKFLKWLS